jgi:hypothetical protein
MVAVGLLELGFARCREEDLKPDLLSHDHDKPAKSKTKTLTVQDLSFTSMLATSAATLAEH